MVVHVYVIVMDVLLSKLWMFPIFYAELVGELHSPYTCQPYMLVGQKWVCHTFSERLERALFAFLVHCVVYSIISAHALHLSLIAMVPGIRSIPHRFICAHPHRHVFVCIPWVQRVHGSHINHLMVYGNGLGYQVRSAELVPKEELIRELELVENENQPLQAVTSFVS